MRHEEINIVAEALLLRLHDQLEEPVHDLTVEQVNNFSNPFSSVQVRTALSLLCQQGFVSPRKVHGTTRYGLTKAGIREVETHFLVLDEASGRSYVALGDEHWQFPSWRKSAPVKETKPGIDWTKWGTILAGVSILVTVAVAYLA